MCRFVGIHGSCVINDIGIIAPGTSDFLNGVVVELICAVEVELLLKILPPVELGNEQEKMVPPVVLGNDHLQFLRRMNKTYVNEDERYIKFQFSGTVYSTPPLYGDNIIRYFDKKYHAGPPFSKVQCNTNERPADLIQSKVQLPNGCPREADAPASRIINDCMGKDSAFTYNGYCFIGKICCSSGDFRNNNIVEKFFNEAQRGSNCFVDETGTTFFVLKDSLDWYTNVAKTISEIAKSCAIDHKNPATLTWDICAERFVGIHGSCVINDIGIIAPGTSDHLNGVVVELICAVEFELLLKILPPVELGNEQEKMVPPVVLGNDHLQFLRRMNKTYVNEDERYIKFQFSGTVYSTPPLYGDNIIRYFDKKYHAGPPFSKVQCNTNERPADLIQSKVQLPNGCPREADAPASRIINDCMGKDSAFTYNGYCFIGKICCSSGDFRNNNIVEKFFNEAQRGSNCFVDETGTTFFVLKDSLDWYTNVAKTVPKFI
ncbi:hypothetical protein NE237_012376 [Protea cynaroides]|uniref:Uncharacterized protein n=1 Tax=Protea cynaroides TaxID=273540 RepID=A0A9Q0JZ65_9MAGN|nr:hypothetical protein NE237_012376 [Protea cynaroides]